MYVRDLLKYIAQREGIPESKIIWDEVEWFEREHKGHGGYQFEVFEDEDGKVSEITGECNPMNIPESAPCSHRNAPDAELSYSIFYVRRKFRDKYSTENLQRARREGRLRVDGEGQLEIVVK